MGKGWHKNSKNGSASSKSDLSSLRGGSCIIATCDVAREREATKELINLLTQAVEEIYPPTTNSSNSFSSIENLLAEEIRECSKKQPVISLNSGVKGFVIVKIVQPNVCPIQIIRSIFDKVTNTKLPCSRHLCRVVPLSKVFFANEVEFETNIKSLISETFPTPSTNESNSEHLQPTKKIKQDEIEIPVGNSEEVPLAVEETSPTDEIPASKRLHSSLQKTEPLLPISLLFKKRNHNTLNRIQVQQLIFHNIPRSKCTVDFKNPKAVFIVELFMNTCGISFFDEIEKYEELNLKKHQQIHCQTDEKEKSELKEEDQEEDSPSSTSPVAATLSTSDPPEN